MAKFGIKERNHLHKCRNCGGTGRTAKQMFGYKPVRCTVCGGSGKSFSC